LTVVVGVAVVWSSDQPEPQPGAGSPAVYASAPSPTPTTGRAPTADATPSFSPEPSGRSLQGRDLAVAWLRGYLTRSSRDDDRWEAALADLSSAELLAELRQSGPDSMGLDPWSSWRVTKVEAYAAADPPVDTPSRRTLTYAAFVNDGHHTVKKPFTLYSYLQADNQWLVTVADQRYASEG
jgi:hypothetical protein